MIEARRNSVTVRDGLAALAALALFMQILVPQGFMFSGNPALPGLVICTGHGPFVLGGDHSQPGKAPKPSQDRPCAFAAHCSAGAPPAVPQASAIGYYAAAIVISRPLVTALGRGLAAPPPPSHAPPNLA